jgi:hypothetical protein
MTSYLDDQWLFPWPSYHQVSVEEQKLETLTARSPWTPLAVNSVRDGSGWKTRWKSPATHTRYLWRVSNPPTPATRAGNGYPLGHPHPPPTGRRRRCVDAPIP